MTITCPQCNTAIEVPKDTEIVVCPDCHTPIEVNQDEEVPGA
jgi:uncharacterized protein YbaR (Trm112 family)